ncbi:MAG: hypothetical protein ACK5PF_08300 [bacterium]
MTLAELTAITQAGPAVIMLAKDDMLAMLEQRARVADNIRKAQRLIKQGYAAHAEQVLNEALDMMKENGK